MGSDEYSRLREACLAMARQPNMLDLQARWLALAQTSLELAKNNSDKKQCSRRFRHN
jgi:hypothetical protein